MTFTWSFWIISKDITLKEPKAPGKELFSVNFQQIINFGAHIDKQGVQQGNGSHGFYDDDRSWYDDGVMSALDRNFDIFSLFVDRLLFLEYGWRRLDMRAQDDRGTIADAAEDSSGMVGAFGHGMIFHDEGIIVLGTPVSGCLYTVADLHGFYGAD